MDSAQLSLPGVTASVPAARQFVRDTLAAWGLDPMVDAAALVVSELTTNAVLHARSDLVVRLSTDDEGGLRVEVVDASAGSPRVRDRTSSATTGRGLAIVGELARSWGVDSSGPGTGKVVWAQLLPEPRSGERDVAAATSTPDAAVPESRTPDGSAVVTSRARDLSATGQAA